jgi:hypothetical protein
MIPTRSEKRQPKGCIMSPRRDLLMGNQEVAYE